MLFRSFTSDCSVSTGPEKEHIGCSTTKNISFYMDIDLDDSLLDDSDEDFEHCAYSDEESDEEFEDLLPVICNQLPFWFGNEEEEQIQSILECYSTVLICPDEFMRSVQPFVGRVKRVNVSTSKHVFQTLDRVTISNCQRMPADKPVLPTIREEYCCTTWDADGIPSITSLTSSEVEEVLHYFENEDDVAVSYLYGQPDWHYLGQVSETEFHYSCSSSERDVIYFGLPSPGNFAPFV